VSSWQLHGSNRAPRSKRTTLKMELQPNGLSRPKVIEDEYKHQSGFSKKAAGPEIEAPKEGEPANVVEIMKEALRSSLKAEGGAIRVEPARSVQHAAL
jgi:non-homologous end joining protein Ku